MSHALRLAGHIGPVSPVVDCSADEVLTDQSFKESADVNNIVRSYRRGLALPDFREGVYADVSDYVDFQESLEKARVLQDYFYSLPAEMRERYGNDPGQFLVGIQDPGNRVDAIAIGLIREDEPVKPVESPEGSSPA